MAETEGIEDAGAEGMNEGRGEAADFPRPSPAPSVTPPPMALMPRETSSTSVAARAQAQIQARYLVAMQRPRNEEAVRQEFLRDCERPGVAEEAEYLIKRGGKDIRGPSVRLAEVALRAMGNVASEAPIVWQDEECLIVNCRVTDLEKNNEESADVRVSRTVERRKPNDDGSYISWRRNAEGKIVYRVSGTEEDIQTKLLSLVARIRRNLIWRIFPAEFREEGLVICRKVIQDRAAKDPDAERRKLSDAFFQMGIGAAALEKFLGQPVGALTPGQLVELRRLWTALRDGSVTWADVAAESAQEAGPGQAPKKRRDVVREKVKAKAAAKAPAAAEAPAPAPSQAAGPPQDAPQEAGAAGQGAPEAPAQGS